ncbi:MAG: phenylalanine--tRNA ligase subunit beta [Promethearchaeota archaeon]
MPALELTFDRLERLLGRKVDVSQLEYDLLWLGLDLKDVQEDRVKVEYEPNRPDFSSPEGIARALRGYYEMELGLPKFELGTSDVVLEVDPSVNRVRPYVVAGLVRNVDLEDDEIATLMNIQEALHHVLGRGRKKVAIGVHDFDKVVPPFVYKAIDPDGIKFRPLQMEAYEMTPREILEEHPKGVEYAHVLAGAEVYPIIVDANDDVLSFPPIINGHLTTVTEDTRTLFLDLTGTDFSAVNYALNILATCLADMGTLVETVTVKYADPKPPVPEPTIVTPDFSTTRWEVDVKFVNSYLGTKLSAKQMVKCLQKVRLGATVHPKKRGKLLVEVPAYRVDLMHPVDFIEEVAIGYNYKNLSLTTREGGVGSYHPTFELANRARTVLAWAGYLEMFNFILTNSRREFEHVGLTSEESSCVGILNPVSREYDTTRVTLLPGLLWNLQANKHVEKPLRLFEVGDVVLVDGRAETGATREVHAAVVTHWANADFSEARSVLDFFARSLGVFEATKVVPVEHPTFLPGRAGQVRVEGEPVGTIGEVHPRVLENFELEMPVAAFEVNLEAFLKGKK